MRQHRQRWRRVLLLVSLVLFPVTLNYLSPYVILDAASQGIVNGSLLVFGALFLSALLLGRVWCGWLCPAGGLDEVWRGGKDRPARLLPLRLLDGAVPRPRAEGAQRRRLSRPRTTRRPGGVRRLWPVHQGLPDEP